MVNKKENNLKEKVNGSFLLVEDSFNDLKRIKNKIFEAQGEGVLIEKKRWDSFAKKVPKSLMGEFEKLQFLNLAQYKKSLEKMVFRTSRGLDKLVELDIKGELWLNSETYNKLKDPLIHLVRNSVDHGIESRAQRETSGKKETGLIVLSVYE